MSPQEQELEEIEKLTDQNQQYERLEKLIFKYPDFHKAYSNIKQAYINLKFFDKAKSFFLKLIEVEPNIAYPYESLADLLFDDFYKDYEQAKKYYEKAIEVNPKHFDSYLSLAFLLSFDHFKDYEQAKKYCELVIQSEPTNAFAYLSLADLLKIDYFKEYELSRKYYEKAIELEPTDAFAYLSLANLLKIDYFKEYELSRKYYEKAIELEPTFILAYVSLAAFLAKDYFKEYELSRKYYEKAIELEPASAFIYISLADLLAEDYFKEYQLSKKYYEKAIDLEPKGIISHRRLANLLSNDYFKEYELAKKNFEMAIDFDPNSDITHLFYANFLANKLINREKAKYHFNKSIEIKTNSRVTKLAQSGLKKIFNEENKPCFISAIKIEKLLHLKDFSIEIDQRNLKHLIITGHNGCGKTVLLNSLRDFLQRLIECDADVGMLDNFEKGLDKNNPDLLSFQPDAKTIYYRYRSGNFVIAHFEARRSLKLKGIKDIINIQFPTFIQITEPDETQNSKTKYINHDFLKYAVNQYIQGALALKKKDKFKKLAIDKWITNFEKILKDLDPRIESINFEEEPDYHFEIIPRKPYEKFTFEQLADGFVSIFSIAAELILRMSNISLLTYEVEGLVLIDEPEAHLHLDLQKKILPILTELFPKVQFIVATHSPFILSSLENVVVYDLEKKEAVKDLSMYSVDNIIETFFETDRYSKELIKKLTDYENLSKKKELAEKEKIELEKLTAYFTDNYEAFSPEVQVKIQEIKLFGVRK